MLQEAQTETATIGFLPSAKLEKAPTDVGSLTAATSMPVYGRAQAPVEMTTLLVWYFPSVRADTELVPEDVGSEEPPAEDSLHAELFTYMALPEGWDGYEGVPASSEAVLDAIDFLEMRPSDIPLPYPQIAPDGEAGLYWHSGEVFAEVGFYGDGEYSYYARYVPVGEDPMEEGRDHCSLGTREWPGGLLFILNRLER